MAIKLIVIALISVLAGYIIVSGLNAHTFAMIAFASSLSFVVFAAMFSIAAYMIGQDGFTEVVMPWIMGAIVIAAVFALFL